jgi:hypothetical protein
MASEWPEPKRRMCRIASSTDPTTLMERIKARYSVAQSFSAAALTGSPLKIRRVAAAPPSAPPAPPKNPPHPRPTPGAPRRAPG